MAKIIRLDSRTFDPAIDSGDKLAIVEYSSPNCVHCAEIRPTYEALSDELSRYAGFYEVDVSTDVALGQRFGVMGTPTFKFFCKGRPIGEIVGSINATLLRNTIKDMLRHKSECVSRSTPVPYEMDGY